MDSFPPEILHNVFTRLELSERLLCTLVCRTWWNVLDNYSLLYNVKIKENDQFNRFMDMIKQAPHRATQVEDLTVPFCFQDDFDKRSFAGIFPNLRAIDLVCERSHGHHTNSSEPMETTQTTSKIQHISDSMDCGYAFQMMNSNLCGQLGTLILDFKSLRIGCQTMLPQIKNMPVLKRLTLVKPYIGVADMELLHSNLPSIQHLILSDMQIKDSEMLPIISAATPLTIADVGIDASDSPTARANWYRYASEKYTNVTRWTYYDWELEEIDDTTFIYENGFLQFLALFASTQSELTLRHLPADVNVFEALDNKDCRIKELSICHSLGATTFQELAQSNQSKYIEKLTIDHTEMGSFQHLQNFTVLTELRIEDSFVDYEDTVNLADLLNALPDTLMELSLEVDDLEADPVDCKWNYVQKLRICNKHITRNIVDTVLSCFPKLVNVLFYGILVENINVILQSSTLKSVRFGTLGVFSYKSPTNPEPEHYKITGGGEGIRVAYQYVKARPVLSVVSFTKRTLKFSSWEIILTQDD